MSRSLPLNTLQSKIKRNKATIKITNHTLENVQKYINQYLKPIALKELTPAEIPFNMAILNHLVNMCDMFKDKSPEESEKIIDDI